MGRRLGLVPLLALAVALTAVFGVGCSRGRPGPPPRETRMLVDNRGYFDVIVYSVPSPGASGRRLGNVNGGSMTALRLTSSDLQLGNQLVVRIRALATNRAWVSPAITITDDVIARLDVQSTSSGDLSRSSLYPELIGTER
ncbi:MAG: hypothetical protein V4617_19060 [Gemmatimonadota bacterium]